MPDHAQPVSPVPLCPGYGRVRIYSGPDGYPLDSWERANRLLAVIRMEMDQGSFDIKKYMSVHLKPLQFSNYAHAGADRREQDWQRQEISWAYPKEIKAYITGHQQRGAGTHDR